MRSRVFVAFVLALAALGVAPASADHCSGKTTPPPEYQGREITVPTFGVKGHVGAPGEAWVGVYYADGYWYLDARDPSRVTWRSFTPWWPGYVDVKITAGAAPMVCGHAKTTPYPVPGDGCLMASVGAAPCAFTGGGDGGYVALAPVWGIYHLDGGKAVLDVGTALGSRPAGTHTFAAGVVYHVCVGTVNVGASAAGACTPGTGIVAAARR